MDTLILWKIIPKFWAKPELCCLVGFFLSRRVGSKIGFSSPHRVKKPSKIWGIKRLNELCASTLHFDQLGLEGWWIGPGVSGLGWGSHKDYSCDSRVLWGDSPFLGSLPWGRHRAQVSLELLCTQGRAPRPCSWASCVSPAVVFQLQLVTHPSLEESEQHLLVRSAGSTGGMPLITVLIGFLLVPSIFSKQKAEGSRCYLLFHNKCSCGTRDPGICWVFFPFSLFLKTTVTLSTPWRKLLIQLGCSKDVLLFGRFNT